MKKDTFVSVLAVIAFCLVSAGAQAKAVYSAAPLPTMSSEFAHSAEPVDPEVDLDGFVLSE